MLVLLAWGTLLGLLLGQELQFVQVPLPGKPHSPAATSVAVKTLGWVVCCQPMACSPS